MHGTQNKINRRKAKTNEKIEFYKTRGNSRHDFKNSRQVCKFMKFMIATKNLEP